MNDSIEDLAARRLDQLGEVLGRPLGMRERPWETAWPQLGQRAVEFRRSIEPLANDRTPSAMVVLRALIELTILTLWIEQCP
jgi:hypothetical protein